MKKRILGACLSLIVILVLGICILQYSGYDIVGKLGLGSTQTVGSIFGGNGLFGNEQTQAAEKKLDLSKAYTIILENGTKEFYEGYPIDHAFLSWMNRTYGDAAIVDIAYQMYEGYIDADLWYEYTGNSMHVLWLLYCKDTSYATYYLENVHWKECASGDVVTIDFTGDINLADDWYTMQAASGKLNNIYDCISEDVVNELQSADISVINNEFVFSDRGTALEGKAYTFRAKTANVVKLDAFGVDLANLANNHAYDYGEVGLLDTIDTLENAGIVTMGAGANIEEAKTIQYFVANGKKIAFVSATEIERFYRYTKEATETEAGVLKTLDPTIYNQVIAEAAKNSDYVIASVHWGTEGLYQYTSAQYNMAEGFVNAGADVVIGGHPHRLQGIEYINNAPVVFSLGNFWFSNGTLYTTIAQVEINREGEIALQLIPCIQKDMTTSMLTAEEAVDFYKFMADLSTNLAIDENGYVYNTKDGRNADKRVSTNYLSGVGYGSYSGSVDLEGRPIDIVGNLE